MIFLIDVSYHQGTIDWPKIKADGIAASVARATIGTKPDTEFQSKTAGAKAAGLIPGAYHFLYPSSIISATEQAEAFVFAVRKSGGTDGMLLMLDVEKDGTAKARGSDMREFVRRFRELVPTHPLLVYAPGWYWRGHIGNPPASDIGPLWNSHYVDVPNPSSAYPYRTLWAKVPSSWWDASHGGWDEATILQFTSSGKVDGYPSRLDVNAFRGSLDDLKALTRDEVITPMKLTKVVAQLGKAKMSKAWKPWRVATDKQGTALPIGTNVSFFATCRYHVDEDTPNGYPGLLFVGAGTEPYVLPAGDEVGLTITPAETLTKAQAEAAVKAATDSLTLRLATIKAKVAAGALDIADD